MAETDAFDYLGDAALLDFTGGVFYPNAHHESGDDPNPGDTTPTERAVARGIEEDFAEVSISMPEYQYFRDGDSDRDLTGRFLVGQLEPYAGLSTIEQRLAVTDRDPPAYFNSFRDAERTPESVPVTSPKGPRELEYPFVWTPPLSEYTGVTGSHGTSTASFPTPPSSSVSDPGSPNVGHRRSARVAAMEISAPTPSSQPAPASTHHEPQTAIPSRLPIALTPHTQYRRIKRPRKDEQTCHCPRSECFRQSFTRLSDLKRHVEDVHGRGKRACQTCGHHYRKDKLLVHNRSPCARRERTYEEG